MIKFLSLLCFLVLFTACGNSGEGEAKSEEVTVPVSSTAATTPPPAAVAANQGTLLCEINGVPWAYTKASGIVSRHKKTGKRTAIITFSKKLDKGSESIQLYYDGDSYQLEKVAVQLKFPKKDGGRLSAMYSFDPSTSRKQPDAQLSGTLDLSDPSAAAGTAEASNVNISYERELLADPTDGVINITGLSFSGVGYSDLNKVKKQLNL